MKPIRYVPVDGAFFEVTSKTLHGRFLLRPSKKVNRRILGVLGRAMKLYPEVQLFAFAFLSNHFHLILWTPDAVTLSKFVGHVKSNIAKEVGRIHSWREKFWGRRFRDIIILDDAALLDRIRYVLANGTKEGLVGSPYAWPGATSVRAMTHGEKLVGDWVDQTGLFNARKTNRKAREEDFTEELEVKISPPPHWRDVPEVERQRRFREMVAGIEEEARDRGRAPLGVPAILEQDPHALPARSSKSSAPWCHGSDADERRRHIAEYSSIIAVYRELSRQVRAGDLSALSKLPAGCHAPVLPYHLRSAFEAWRARPDASPGSAPALPFR